MGPYNALKSLYKTVKGPYKAPKGKALKGLIRTFRQSDLSAGAKEAKEAKEATESKEAMGEITLSALP